jgi:hypothetical protein
VSWRSRALDLKRTRGLVWHTQGGGKACYALLQTHTINEPLHLAAATISISDVPIGLSQFARHQGTSPARVPSRRRST